MAWQTAKKGGSTDNQYGPKLPADITTDAIVVRVVSSGVDKNNNPKYRISITSTESKHNHGEAMLFASGGWLNGIVATCHDGIDYDPSNEYLVSAILLGQHVRVETKQSGEYVNANIVGMAKAAPNEFVTAARAKMQDAILQAAAAAREEIAAQVRQGVLSAPPSPTYPLELLQSIGINAVVGASEEVPDDDIPF
jgi:hypothetical protein